MPGEGDYIFLTLDRPSNVDEREKLSEIAGVLNDIAVERRIFFPIHPRTEKMLETHGILKAYRGIRPRGGRQGPHTPQVGRACIGTNPGGVEELCQLKVFENL